MFSCRERDLYLLYQKKWKKKGKQMRKKMASLNHSNLSGLSANPGHWDKSVEIQRGRLGIYGRTMSYASLPEVRYFGMIHHHQLDHLWILMAKPVGWHHRLRTRLPVTQLWKPIDLKRPYF